MSRYIAFLRAINVGGHTVKMDQLRLLLETLNFSNVETFIASGNVIFETGEQDSSALERKIAELLRRTLGYDVAVFIRTDVELARIADYKPFEQTELDAAAALNIAFLAEPLDETSAKRLMALKNEIDNFHVNEREVYWLCQVRQSDSKFSNAVFEKVLGRKATFRGVNTIRKMAEKYSSPDA
jgi:uncharacterized protein (DUF1697 family)